MREERLVAAQKVTGGPNQVTYTLEATVQNQVVR